MYVNSIYKGGFETTDIRNRKEEVPPRWLTSLY